MIQFKFDPEKIIQIVDFLVARNSFALNYTKMIKLLYLADREALKEHDIVITGDKYCSMKSGPVLSEILDLVNGEHQDNKVQKLWDSHFKTIGFDIIATTKKETGCDKLNDYEISLLTKIDEKFKDFDYGQMIKFIHNKKEFPEVRWKEADEMGTSLHLGIEDILMVFGRTGEEIEEIERETESLLEEHTYLSDSCGR